MEQEKHYLEAELDELMARDSSIFSFITEFALDGLWYWDLEKPKNEWMSPSFWKLFGYEPYEKKHLASEWQNMVDAKDLELALENAKKHMESPDYPYDQIVRYKHRNGKTIWVRCRGVVIRDDEGQPTRMLGAHLDYTHIKAMEQKVVSVLDSAPDAMLMIDETGEIVYINAQTEKLFGYSKSELLKSRIETLVPERFRENHPSHIEKFFEAPKFRPMGINLELFGQHKKGHEIPVEISLSYIEGDEEEGALGVAAIRDISQRKKEESERRLHQEKLEHLNKDLDSFSYSVSHDLRAPLRHVNGYVDLLREEISKNNVMNEKMEKYIDVIRSETNRMGELIDDLLEFSRAGRLALNRIVFNFDKIIEGIIEDYKSMSAHRNIIWQVEAMPEVYADPKMMKLVWENLISNAVKFSRNKAEPKIEVTSRKTSKHFIFEIKDNGVGFDVQYAEKVFGVFQRLHTREEFEGTGIGLSNVEKIVTRHGGEVNAKGKLGKGASITFSLPRNGKVIAS